MGLERGAAENEVKNVVWVVLEYSRQPGRTAVANRGNYTAHESERVLIKLTISSEEVIRDAIDEILKYTPNHDSFQKFVQMYKLEKRQVKKSYPLQKVW